MESAAPVAASVSPGGGKGKRNGGDTSTLDKGDKKTRVSSSNSSSGETAEPVPCTETVDRNRALTARAPYAGSVSSQGGEKMAWNSSSNANSHSHLSPTSSSSGKISASSTAGA